MTAIAISLLFGLAAGFSLLTIALSVIFCTRRGIEMLREIAVIDGSYHRRRLLTLSLRNPPEQFAPLWPKPCADV